MRSTRRARPQRLGMLTCKQAGCRSVYHAKRAGLHWTLGARQHAPHGLWGHLCTSGAAGLRRAARQRTLLMAWRAQVFLEREIVTTIPTAQKPRGVVFAFHGCLQYVTEFGFKSASCPNCHGARPAGVRSSALNPSIVPGLVHAALVQRLHRRSPWPPPALQHLS